MGNQRRPVAVGLAELHRNTSDVVRRVESGEEVVVTVSGRSAIRLVGVAQKKTWVSAAEFAAIFAAVPPWGVRERDEEFIDEDFPDPWDDGTRRRLGHP